MTLREVQALKAALLMRVKHAQGEGSVHHEILMAAARAELERLAELRTSDLHLKAQKLNAQARLLELAKMERAVAGARHTRAPWGVPGGPGAIQGSMPDYTPEAAGLPVGMTEGMVRMASASGELLAKQASSGRLDAFIASRGGLAGKTLGMSNAVVKPLALVGAAGGMYAGLKGLQHGLRWLGREAETPTYNAGGPQLASEVNEYGQAQQRLPSRYY